MQHPLPSFTIHRPPMADAEPDIIHVPHAADHIPDHCRADFVLGRAELGDEIAAMFDHFTATIAASAVAMDTLATAPRRSGAPQQRTEWCLPNQGKSTEHELAAVGTMQRAHEIRQFDALHG